MDTPSCSRFEKYSLEEEENLSKVQHRKKTKYSTTWGTNLLGTFCKETLENFIDVSLLDESCLPAILKKFYMCARTEDGELYSIQ